MNVFMYPAFPRPVEWLQSSLFGGVTRKKLHFIQEIIMPRFFLSKEQLTDMTSVTLSGDDARHISFSLRMAVGDRLILSDGEGQEYEARLTSFTEDSVTAEILSSRKSLAEPPVQIRLYQAYPKGDKLDTIVQKAVELGVSSVIPFVSERCIKRPPKEKAEKNTRKKPFFFLFSR